MCCKELENEKSEAQLVLIWTQAPLEFQGAWVRTICVDCHTQCVVWYRGIASCYIAHRGKPIFP